MARNIVNPELIDQFIDFSTDAIGNSLAEKWLNSVFHNYMINSYPGVVPYTVKRNDADWMKKAKARGDTLLSIKWPKGFSDEINNIVRYIHNNTFTDISRISYPDMVIKSAKWHLDEAERKRKEKAAAGGVILCKFSDGKQAVLLASEEAIKEEAKRQKNCLRDYVGQVQRDEYKVVSIRDANGKSIISIGYQLEENDLDCSIIFDQAKESCNARVKKENRPYVTLINERLKADGCNAPFRYKTKKSTAKPETDLDLFCHNITALPKVDKVNGNLNISKTKIAVLPVKLEVHGGLYASDTPLQSIPAGEYTGNVDISRTQITSLPANSVFHGHVYAAGLNLTIPDTTVVKGKIYR